MYFYGPKIMKKYETPYFVNNYLIIWNLILSVFSILGTYYFSYPVFKTFIATPYYDNLCINDYYENINVETQIWYGLFVISKVFELIDTLFLILKKKSVNFLHVYHHISVLIFCWFGTRQPISLYLKYFACMNYFVHSIMYTYFFATSLKIVPKYFPSYLITVLQILQMILGLVITGSVWYYIFNNILCPHHLDFVIYSSLMYGSYLALFLHFFIKRYCKFYIKSDKSV